MIKSKVAPWALGLGIVALGYCPLQAQPAPDSISLLQKVCLKHSAIKTAHLKIAANLPEGWKEQSELWIDRPTRLNYDSKVTPPTGGEVLENHVLADGGKLTIWSSLPNPNRPDLKNVYMRDVAPPDVYLLFESPARFGLGDFFLRLCSGEPNQLAHARLQKSGALEFDRLIKGLTPDELGLVSQDGKEMDELQFDTDSGLLKEVRAKSEDKVVASGNITYVSVNQPLEPGSFDWRVPAGAHEVKPPPSNPPHP